MSRVRPVALGDLSTLLEHRPDGSKILRASMALKPYPGTMLERLQHWAVNKPEHLFIAQRCPERRDQWINLTYRETWEQVQRLASGLLRLPLSVDRPIAVLSGNDISHALLGMAAMYIGVPYAPVSVQYSLVSKDHAKLKYVLDLITPGLVFVSEAEPYARAMANAVPADTPVMVERGKLAERECLRFDELLKTALDPEAARIHDALDPDGIAKFLFSSGSTGVPKAVINTHRMLTANQQMIVQSLPCLAEPAPVLVDWLPWNHTFGGNHNVGIALYNGGSYYIDEGKPTPAGFCESVRNLKEIAPTAFYNVPKGFEELVKHLRADEQLRKHFFSRVSMLFYAGAGISQPVWDALDQLALDSCGERIMIVTGLGCTETAPSALFTTGDGGFAGWIGLPVPGVEAKLVPTAGKLEIRLRGDNVTPGYWRNAELTEKAFDDEGFFCTGDAVKFRDDNDPQQGLVFDGRISEDFKLDTGTWVSAGPLRAGFLDHFGDLVKDVVIVGRDRPWIGALVFPDLDYCRRIAEQDAAANDAEVLNHPVVRQQFAEKLQAFAAQATGSANRVQCLLLQTEPPSLDRHEITDKGSLNASAIQDNRAEQIAIIYSEEDELKIICPG